MGKLYRGEICYSIISVRYRADGIDGRIPSELVADARRTSAPMIGEPVDATRRRSESSIDSKITASLGLSRGHRLRTDRRTDHAAYAWTIPRPRGDREGRSKSEPRRANVRRTSGGVSRYARSPTNSVRTMRGESRGGSSGSIRATESMRWSHIYTSRIRSRVQWSNTPERSGSR